MRHRFHALCPYFAMFPEAFAEHWIGKTTRPGELVLDPFCGRGTAPFQALLQGRAAIGNDINPVAWCVTRAKTNPPALGSLRRRVTMLERDFEPEVFENERRRLPPFFRAAYNASTLRQILYVRSRLDWQSSEVDCMLAALTLGALHGESARSPSYLSNQMPRTISTKPQYSIDWWKREGWVAPRRDIFDLLRLQAAYRYETGRLRGDVTVIEGDMRDLYRYDFEQPVRSVITSPPYLDITNFEEDQWLRLWFLGGPPYPTRGLVSTDDRHETPDKYWSMLGDMWRTLGQIVDDRGHVVIRIGGKGLRAPQIVDRVVGVASLSGRSVKLVEYEVSPMRGRQTHSFRPGDVGLAAEVDLHFRVA